LYSTSTYVVYDVRGAGRGEAEFRAVATWLLTWSFVMQPEIPPEFTTNITCLRPLLGTAGPAPTGSARALPFFQRSLQAR